MTSVLLYPAWPTLAAEDRQARTVGTVNISPMRSRSRPANHREDAVRLRDLGAEDGDMPPLHRGVTFGRAPVASISKNRQTHRPDTSSLTGPARVIGSAACQRTPRGGCWKYKSSGRHTPLRWPSARPREAATKNSTSAFFASDPGCHWPSSQVCPFSGASMPNNRTSWGPNLTVSPSTT